MSYSYGKENLRPYTRASTLQREPEPPILVPQPRKRRESVPVQQRRIRQQRNPAKRIRLQIVLGIGLILFSLLVIMRGALVSNQFLRLQFLPPSQINQTDQGSALSLLFPVQKISRSVAAFSQADKTQYNNENPQWSQWSYSACSGCAMAALMDAYGANLNGKPLNCGDVLEAEYRLSVYNPINSWGLQRGVPDELAKTAAQFGFTGYSTQKLSLDDLITLANAGTPSIVRIPSHIMILTGGDSQHVFLADSGGLHLSQVTRTQFLHGLPGSKLYAGQAWMAGWYIILTPNKQNT